jgi:hypothetical protein
MESDPLVNSGTEDPSGGTQSTLDERLYGVWRWELGSTVEEIRITPTAGKLGSLSYCSKIYTPALQEQFAGTIVYAQNFSSSAGIIIIEYTPGHKQQWVDWSKANPPTYMPLRNDQPAGNFYGIYFINLNSGGTQVFLACTNDQNNNYGPTEPTTLEQAKAKFTQGNMNQLLDLSVGDPQTKVQDL